ncbi:sigma-70 family RNA polymerase sigma factor [Klebsiella variicola]|uniref:sigma-70 family RNA polymerase sigma factor n=1 Tax=Klebsiella variicola TaxID=244366 RepID=UPI0009BC27B1|nr:sigma-70 family RNA polymerase sigma factor [Klebsiella variicola]HCI5738446.1 sigma-70 family RNA polymerase sigma factor [Klebsiella variicola subsp. variicola]HCI6877872.1 sigma-70 family RNA polymerase sigma factor [Klebsiella quasipneumoniae subsp. similipneumoniae]SLP35968.1 Sigma-70 region 2 [Klebsiella variicola]SXG02824.1 Sigma-70 region 2 [Klebsiella variicola]HED4010346.1 sigma-70 family RNA polymerase sigma factor [Klebsiella variicola subsp. variicola]
MHSDTTRLPEKGADLLTIIFRSDYRWLINRLRRSLAGESEAEDVASEAFVRLAAMPDLSHLREPRAMLTTLAKRVLFENWRRRDLERVWLSALASAPGHAHPSPEDQEILLEALLAIDQALDGLSVKARQAFLFSQLDGLTYAEIASRLGVSVSMVRKYITSALTQCYLATQPVADGV